MIPTPPASLLQWALRGAFWIVVLIMPGGLLLVLIPWLRRHLQKQKNTPCKGH
jgi:hypothetical protein